MRSGTEERTCSSKRKSATDGSLAKPYTVSLRPDVTITGYCIAAKHAAHIHFFAAEGSDIGSRVNETADVALCVTNKQTSDNERG